MAGDPRWTSGAQNVRRHRKQEKLARKKHVKDVQLSKFLIKRQARDFGVEGEIAELDLFPFLD